MESLKSKAYEIIKKRIVSCEYAPGDILDEKALIDEFGVSRTPIREALNVLAEEGMVDIMPRLRFWFRTFQPKTYLIYTIFASSWNRIV